MVTVSRSTRILRYLQYAPRHLFNKYPEQFVCYLTFGLAGAIIAGYKLSTYGHDGGNYKYIANLVWYNDFISVKPYYRGRYQVVRPDDPIALNWRPPSDYPPRYLSNRENHSYESVAKDYGWTAKI